MANVVITGASSGIGRATALALARRGENVALVSRQQEALDELAVECRALGAAGALPLAADVADTDAVEAVAARTVSQFGRLDVWVNNAAVTLFGQLDQVPAEDFRRVIDTNIIGYVNGARAALARFRPQRSGTLINVASIVGKGGQAWADAYAVSKFGIYGLSSALRQDLIHEPGIHIVTVIPPSVDTPLFQHGGNYSGKPAKAIWPAYRPETVARAIIGSIARPRREVPVGVEGWAGVIVSRFFPALFEAAFARMVRSAHFQDRPQPPTHGNLFTPDPRWNTVSGGWRRRPWRRRKV